MAVLRCLAAGGSLAEPGTKSSLGLADAALFEATLRLEAVAASNSCVGNTQCPFAVQCPHASSESSSSLESTDTISRSSAIVLLAEPGGVLGGG